jgi:hypothetical protein
MAFTPVAGKTLSRVWTPSGGSAATLAVIENSWQEAVDKVDVTNSTSNGEQALLASILRGSGSIKAVLDSDTGKAFYLAAIGIRAGGKGTFTHTMSTGNAYSIPAMIVSVNSVVAIAGAVMYDFTIELDSLSGTYTRPSA